MDDRCGVTVRSKDSSNSAADRIWKYVRVVLVAWRAPPLAQCARSGRFLNTHTHTDARTRARTHIMDCNLRIPVTLTHTACKSRWPSLGPLPLLKGGFGQCASLENHTFGSANSKMASFRGLGSLLLENFVSNGVFWPTYRSAQNKVSHGALYPEAAQRATGIRNENRSDAFLRISL